MKFAFPTKVHIMIVLTIEQSVVLMSVVCTLFVLVSIFFVSDGCGSAFSSGIRLFVYVVPYVKDKRTIIILSSSLNFNLTGINFNAARESK